MSAPKITLAARFCSLRIHGYRSRLSAEQFDQIDDPCNITCLIIAVKYALFNRDESPYLSKNRYSLR